MEFKLNLPNLCPPEETESINLKPVYRLIKGEDIRENDLLSHVEEGRRFPPNKKCEAHAISIFKNMEGCENLQKKFSIFRDKKIYKGQITKECGVVDLYLGTNHLNLWVFNNVDLLSIFTEGGVK